MKKIIILAVLSCWLVTTTYAQHPNGERRAGPPSLEQLLEMDANKDGQLSKAEVRGPLSKDFTKADQNKDGFLSKAELEQLPARPAPNRERRAGPPSLEQLLEMDVNKDGQLSKTEVRGPLSKDFERVDINKDGLLSKAELQQLPAPQKRAPRAR